MSQRMPSAKQSEAVALAAESTLDACLDKIKSRNGKDEEDQ